MEILQLPEHPAIQLANKFSRSVEVQGGGEVGCGNVIAAQAERKLEGSSLLVMSNSAAGPDGRSKPEDPTARNLDFSSLEVGGVIPGVLSVQIPFSPSSPISSSSIVVIAPPSEIFASQEALGDCELSNSAVMEVESGVNLDIEDPEFIQSLTSRSEPIITESNSTFAGGAYLPADELDEQDYQRGRAIDCLREFKGRGPPLESVLVSHMAPHLAARVSVPFYSSMWASLVGLTSTPSWT